MKIKHAIAALVLGQVVMVGQASAACVAGDIAGTWYVHGVFIDYNGPGEGGDWVRCKLVVNSSGRVSTSASQCFMAGPATSPQAVTVTAGTLRVSTACAITTGSSVTTSPAGRIVLQFGQMDKSHNALSAVGYTSGHSNIKFVLDAVKQ